MSDTGLYNSNKPKIDTSEPKDVTLELGDIIEIHSEKANITKDITDYESW